MTFPVLKEENHTRMIYYFDVQIPTGWSILAKT
jgi:hypothetical protein